MTHEKSTASNTELSLAKLALVGTLLGPLAACGGSGQSSGLVEAPEQIVEEAEDLLEDIIDPDGELVADFTPIASSEIPVTGTADYDGYIGGQLGSDSLTARLSVEVNFVTSRLTTTADQFILGTDTVLAGSLTGDDDINRDGSSPLPQIVATITGDIDGESSALALDGNFLVETGSSDIAAIGGQVEGNIGTQFLTDGIFAGE
ncbi:MAG: hypothetical protein AAFP98_12705 [Pseudomonadota bacterium]